MNILVETPFIGDLKYFGSDNNSSLNDNLLKSLNWLPEAVFKRILEALYLFLLVVGPKVIF